MARVFGRLPTLDHFAFALWAMKAHPNGVPSAVEISGFLQISLSSARRVQVAWRQALHQFQNRTAATGSDPSSQRGTTR